MNINFKSFVLAAMLMGMIPAANAQISQGGAPMFNHAKDGVKVAVLPAVDNQKYLDEDMNSTKGSALRIGVNQKTKINNIENGTITTLADGTRVWRMTVNSPKAQFLMINFSNFDIPEGAELFIYDASGEFVLGGFTKVNTLEGNKFYTQAIPGESATIEYREPAAVAGQGRLEIDEVTHGYKEIFNNMFPKGPLGDAEGTCHINVKCSAANDWRDEIRSVVCYQLTAGPYVFSCSGSLINNTNQDRTPYVLSAHHCQDLGQYGTISRWVTYFNYQTSNCNNNSGPCNQSMVGADILAMKSGNGGSDFMLFRLKNNVPDSYKPYYSGWDRSSGNSSLGCCIHHPGGDFKKISFPRLIEKGTGSNNKLWVVYWYTGAQNQGVTEQGSSGSPLYNAEHRIVGQLYAGTSACDNMGGYDVYGRMYNSWTGGNSVDTRLKDWLDPTGSNVEVLDGLDYKDPDPVAIDEVNARQLKIYPNPSTGMFHIDVDELGMANYKVFDLTGRCIMEGRTVLTATQQSINLTSLKAGVYRLVLYTASNSYGETVVIK